MERGSNCSGWAFRYAHLGGYARQRIVAVIRVSALSHDALRKVSCRYETGGESVFHDS